MSKRLIVPHRMPSRQVDISPDDSQSDPKTMHHERRRSKRFPIQLKAELHVGNKSFPGITTNISSSGLLLACSNAILPIGKRVKVRIINWPGLRPNEPHTTVVVVGSVVRNGSGFVAIQRMRHEFVRSSATAS